MLHITRHRTVSQKSGNPEVRKVKILIVDDDPQVRRRLRLGMSGQGYIVDGAKSGAEALDQLHSLRPDLVLLASRMPGIDGAETCRMIRATSDAAVIMLTAKKSVEDQVAVLDAGADDFLSKPFSMPELLTRVSMNLRRMNVSVDANQTFAFDDVQINLVSRQATVSGEPRRFTPKEFELLSYLVTNPNKVIPHAQLLRAIWGPEFQSQVQYLHIYISDRSAKRSNRIPPNPRYILTEPWVGYRFSLPPNRWTR